MIINNLKRHALNNFKIIKIPNTSISTPIISSFNSNNNKISNYSTTNNNNNNIESNNIIQKRKISKELEALGAYLPTEEYTEVEFDDNDEDYDNEFENHEKHEKDQTLPKQQQYNNNNNKQEISLHGKKFQDMIYRIKENQELQAKHSVDLLSDIEYDSFEELERKLDEKLKKKYEEKMETLDSMEQIDFTDKNRDKVELYNKISNNFIPASTHFETPFEKTEKQLENKEIQRPTGLSSMVNSNSAFNKVEDVDNNSIASRISKIKQRIQKDKLTNHRINGEDLVNLYALYREDPILNNAKSLALKYNLNEKSTENLLKYTTIPIIVKFNTGIKSGHWNVIYER